MPVQLKLQYSHISIWLLLVFSASFVPFNSLHHHAEDEHVTATHFHIDEESHSCELDEQICQTQFESHCEHKTHIAKPVSKCFTCDFHFIKQFENCVTSHHYFLKEISVFHSTNVIATLTEAFILLSNKGPPAQLV